MKWKRLSRLKLWNGKPVTMRKIILPRNEGTMGSKIKRTTKSEKKNVFMPSVWFVGLTPHEGPLLIKTMKSECLKISILISSFHDFIVLIYVLYYWIHSWNKYCRLCHKRLSLHVSRHKTLYTIILGISTSTRLSLGQDDQRLMFF